VIWSGRSLLNRITKEETESLSSNKTFQEILNKIQQNNFPIIITKPECENENAFVDMVGRLMHVSRMQNISLPTNFLAVTGLNMPGVRKINPHICFVD
jgi:hypothetical protein